MYTDSDLKVEVISFLFGQTVTPFDRKRCQTTANFLSVDDFHLHNLIGQQQACADDFFINAEKFFDSAYDCDFTDLSDSAEYMRGDELYQRPKGWYRMALKVKDRYPDGDAWLGTEGWRSHSVPGEWPVSYHGTGLDGVKGIIRSNYTAGERDMYGRGIYSTPDIHVAERENYAKTFTSEATGKSYKVILQNRINPEKREICQRSDYWLIPVPNGASAAEEKQIVESSIRPYGILIKEINDEDESSDDESRYDDRGDENRGDEDTGDEDRGDEDTGDGDRGDEDTGDGDRGDEDTGDGDRGDEDTGDGDRGDEDTGDDDRASAAEEKQIVESSIRPYGILIKEINDEDESSDDESRYDDRGDENRGDEDTGDEDRGDEDTGDGDRGDEDTGDGDRGDEDTGDGDRGDEDTGDGDRGDEDTGDDDRASAAEEKQIVESSIRPYGILIKEINDPCGSSPTSQSKSTAALAEAPQTGPPIQHRLPLHLSPQLPSICPLFPPATLIAGDSVVRGVRFFNADTCSFPGSTVPDILANLQSLLPMLPSSVNRLIVHVGTNDMAREHSELTKIDFNHLLEFLRKSGKEAFLSGPIPTLNRGSVRFSRIRTLNIWLQSACRAHNVGFIDNFNLFWNRRSLYARDGLHPNKAGAKVLKANIHYTVHSYPHD
ncbi:uncharacterized protein LOC142971920 [Anarhichas minor]|uniref:uncharacterized protein LOC142971920 n=1 Tax=Anarhichas minor TaxID=65739 RepID=UPI003F739B45